MANKKIVAALAALLLVAVALAPAAAMDCKAGCAELKASPLGTADCEKKCAELTASKGDPLKDAKWDIP